MTRRAHRSAHGRPLPDGPAPFTTLVELTFDKRKVEHWIRFGRKSYEQIIDRRRSVVGFAPGSVFAFVRWASGDHGTVVSRIDIVRAIGRGEPFQTLPFVRPGGIRHTGRQPASDLPLTLPAVRATRSIDYDTPVPR